MPAFLLACGLRNVPNPTNTPIESLSIVLPPTATLSILPTATSDEYQADQPKKGVQIWSLGGNGWALEIGDRMLVFDYVESGGANPPAPDELRNLQRGYIDPDELSSYEVYVFVTHSHQDHFDNVIFRWQDRIAQITYIFGWQAGNNPDHHYLVNPRTQTQIDGVEVYTINSRSDVPEVAYLVKVEGLVIYFNGDYRGSYLDDFEYLDTLTDHINIAFVIGWPYVSHQNFQQAKLLAEMFNPPYMFASCREGDEDTCRQFAELLPEHGVSSAILYAEHRGSAFVFSENDIE